ncbi:hypothetical protein BDQ17DRAFT_1250922 [Cyathus striatus]|nr:hypothetical protein BDQ17DRAFT_1250922 [Cyathus striatus]
MLAFLLTRVFPAAITLSSVNAIVVNVTVDDASPDPLTGQSITYNPENFWNYGPTCSICGAHVDEQEMYHGTWHDGTYYPSGPRSTEGSLNATFIFNGTAIYIYCAISLSIQPLVGYSNMTFFIDNEAVGHFEWIPPGDNTYQYNVLVYSNASIIPGEHTFLLKNGQEGDSGDTSLTLFDYLVYS